MRHSKITASLAFLAQCIITFGKRGVINNVSNQDVLALRWLESETEDFTYRFLSGSLSYPPAPESHCEDDKVFSIELARKTVTCDFVGYSIPEVTSLLCPIKVSYDDTVRAIEEICPESCDFDCNPVNCEDDMSFFTQIGDQEIGCDYVWFSLPEDAAVLCETETITGPLRDMCPEACGSAGCTPTAAPMRSPTGPPTVSTPDSFPTEAPVFSPESFPTEAFGTNFPTLDLSSSGSPTEALSSTPTDAFPTSFPTFFLTSGGSPTEGPTSTDAPNTSLPDIFLSPLSRISTKSLTQAPTMFPTNFPTFPRTGGP